MFSFQDIKDESSFMIHFLQAEPVILVQILIVQIDRLTVLVLESKPLWFVKRERDTQYQQHIERLACYKKQNKLTAVSLGLTVMSSLNINMTSEFKVVKCLT